MSVTIVHALLLDDPLGRLKKPLMSQQMLMELLLQNIQNRKKIIGPPHWDVPVKNWTGVSFNESHQITEIEWCYYELIGQMDLQWLPDTLQKLNLNNNHISGEIDLALVPISLKWMSLSSNSFSGRLRLERIPSRFHQICDCY